MEMISLLYVFVYVKLGVVIFKNTAYISGIDGVSFMWEVSYVLLHMYRDPRSSVAGTTSLPTWNMIFPNRRNSLVDRIIQGYLNYHIQSMEKSCISSE